MSGRRFLAANFPDTRQNAPDHPGIDFCRRPYPRAWIQGIWSQSAFWAPKKAMNKAAIDPGLQHSSGPPQFVRPGKGRAMLKRLLDTVREYPLLKLLLFFHGMAIAILAALYYMRVDAVLWGSILAVPVVKDADGRRTRTATGSTSTSRAAPSSCCPGTCCHSTCYGWRWMFSSPAR